jgi:hypothetical protein
MQDLDSKIVQFLSDFALYKEMNIFAKDMYKYAKDKKASCD